MNLLSIFSDRRLWILIVLIAMVFFIVDLFYLSVRRKKMLAKVNLKKSDSEQDKNHWLQSISGALNKIFSGDEDDIKAKFIAAGFYNGAKYASYFMPVKYGALILGGIAIYLLGLEKHWSSTSYIIYGSLWLLFTLIFPDSFLASRAKNLKHKISGNLPYLLDLMAVCVQTGMTIEAAMQYLSLEMKGFDDDISYLLDKTNDRARIVGMERSLDELQIRVPTTEIQSFVMTLKQSMHHGTSIYQVLSTLSSDMREVQVLELEEKVGKLSSKMSIPLILFIMVPIVILIAAPGVMRMLL
ncbi:type II secretion system F family protein [Vibrio neonatus]|uniref:type II secretion system F family protein n=1 Tax=Vibrio neonatus TaxID=278860 RepID=UPI0021C3F887|nr:type II secretion system F family protein [Vibrio neonatus]